jgi:hypothetical protein
MPITCLLLSLLALAPVSTVAETAPHDRLALAGLKETKAIFDVRQSEQDKLFFNLERSRKPGRGSSGRG